MEFGDPDWGPDIPPTRGQLIAMIARAGLKKRYSEIDVASLELEKVESKVSSLFDREDAFYADLSKMSRIPLQLDPEASNHCRIFTKKDDRVDYTWRG